MVRFWCICFDLSYLPRSNMDLTEALGVLKGFSFVPEENSGSFDMHRLVQLVTRKWLISRGTTSRFRREAGQPQTTHWQRVTGKNAGSEHLLSMALVAAGWPSSSRCLPSSPSCSPSRAVWYSDLECAVVAALYTDIGGSAAYRSRAVR